jgi:hypothetical protein
MTQDEIIEMAIKAELNLYVHDLTEKQYIQVIEAFAKLVAAHTLSNIDPSSFMSYQEGFEAGNRLAIDGICKQLRQLHDSYSCASDPSAIRARGEKRS